MNDHPIAPRKPVTSGRMLAGYSALAFVALVLVLLAVAVPGYVAFVGGCVGLAYIVVGAVLELVRRGGGDR